MTTPGIFPGTPNNGTNIQGTFIPAGAGDFVPLPNRPQSPVDPLFQQANHLSNPTPPNNTLVYSPDVRIVIAHTVGPVAQQFDVSNDIVRGTVIRKENAASTLIWQCHNKNLRYTNGMINNAPIFSRMDRVVCYMKRAGTWIQVFSGYLDSVPYLQLYPSIVQFKATCTLKRLIYYYWNPGLPESISIFNQFNSASQATGGDGQAGGSTSSGGTTNKYSDTGLGNLLSSLLVTVGHWDPSTVHIQNFPSGFMDLLTLQMQQQQQNNNQAVEYFKQLMGVGDTPAPGAAGGYNTGAGAPGPSMIPAAAGGVGAPSAAGTGSQAFYVQEIVAACDALGMGPNTTNLNLSTGVQQAAVAGEGSRDQATQAAFQQTQQVAQNYQTAMKGQDAAILGVATAIVESGLRNLANTAVAGSQDIPNDGTGHDGTSVGLFQQTEGNNWGTLAQRMNPRQSATMFFTRLQSYDWRNLDPGVACWDVQRAADAGGYEGKIDAAIPQATQLVQQYRNANATPGSSTQSTVTGSLPTQQATSLAAPLGISGTGALNNPTASPNVILTSGGANGTGPTGGLGAPTVGGATGTRPNPDSEGAIAFAASKIGLPYVWGGTGPNGYDCSGLLQAAFQSIGLAIGRDTTAQARSGQSISPAGIQRGDALQCEGGGHTMLWLGDGTIIEAATEGVPIHRRAAYVSPSAASGIFRYCQNGGAIPGVGGAITGAPYNNPQVSGPGNPPSIVLASQGGVNGGSAPGSNEPIARNLFAYIFQPQTFMTDVSFMYSRASPEKDFINSQPLMQAVQSVAGASLRNFASAPNGDFIAYYPDFFGMDGKPAVFLLEDVELKDLTLNFSDDALATHVYVNGDLSMVGETDATLGWLQTMGYATIENQMLYQRMRLVSPGDLENMTGQALMARFGVRPIEVTMAMAGTQELEFLLAVRLFMEKWAAQYQSSVGMTFMPDLFPGMRVLFTNHNLQVYVQEVTHHFDFEQGFSTDVIVTAPSNPNVRNLWAAANTNVPTTVGQVPTTVTI